MKALIEFKDVCKYYYMGDTVVKAADRISFQIYKGEFVAIVGQSGSGKSTCMNIIGCLDVPTDGTYLLDGRDVGQMNKNELAEIRNELLGFIFQQYNLLLKLNLVENVEVPLMYAGVPRAERRERALLALDMVGLRENQRVLNQNGLEDTADNIDALLERRWQNKKLLRAGKHPKGPARRTKEQDEAFAKALEELLRGCAAL